MRGAAGRRWPQKAIGSGVVVLLVLLMALIDHFDRNTSEGVS